MAEAGVLLDQDKFSCPICLDLLKDPVTIPCGHSFCKDCIKGRCDKDDHTGVHSCHECRETFTSMPVNIMLASVMENLKIGPGDVACDVCTGRKHKASESCLVCLASYCETHLLPHYESPAFKKHKRVKATVNLQEKICSHHNKLLEVYCRTDEQCICYQCTMDQHKGHITVLAATERTEKQKLLPAMQSKFQRRVQEREKELQDLRPAVQSLKVGTDQRRRQQLAARRAISGLSQSELVRSIERKLSEVKELIRDQENAEVSRAERHQERLEQEIAELRRRDAELEQLSHTEDHIHFLQSCQTLCGPPGPEDLPSITVSPHVSFEALRKSVSELIERLEDFYKVESDKVSGRGWWTNPIAKSVLSHCKQHTEPKTREDFLQYSCQLTMDPNTAHRHLSLSEGNRKVTQGIQLYPDYPERFEYLAQVLCREGLSRRCYWEAEWSGEDGVYIAVSYKEISRKGQGVDNALGKNDKSWCLACSSSGYVFWHNYEHNEVRGPPSSRIGVYLDHRAGTLSFYSVSDTVTLLNRVQTTFTQPLYPGFGFMNGGSSVNLCDLG